VKALCLCLAAAALWAAPPLDPALKAAEERYNRARTLQADFEQRYLVRGRPRKVESGRLSLQKPGRMLWEYREPEGKFFLSDGKFAYFYSRAAGKVERTRLRESEDFRTPLAFLLGRLKFSRDFEDLSLNQTPQGLEVAGHPKTPLFDAEKVVFLLSPLSEVLRLAITQIDSSVLEFMFTHEKLNVPFAPATFQFVRLPGVDVVDVKVFGVE
jgi:outer membrane lipoprotein carrier protein